MKLVYSTKYGKLYKSDCLELLRQLPESSVHTFFADPPFNLGKNYGPNGNDDLPEEKYLEWSKKWLREAVRSLAPGGALFIHNLPKWLIPLGNFLNSIAGLTFRHWIAIDKPHSLPIPNRLSPSHYGLLFYIKGPRPRVFNKDAVRLPIETCRMCGRDIKDYGGHRKHLNPKGLNLSEVWDDVSPVRHRKNKNRMANELAPVILERVILLTTVEGDMIVDPFAGGGTTAFVAEKLKRRWIAGDVNDCSAAKVRLLQYARQNAGELNAMSKRYPSGADTLSSS